MNKLLSLIVGSIAGGLSRYYLAGWISRVSGTEFPFGTLIVNLTGCFLIGFFASISDEKFLGGSNGRLLLMVGFCGAYTTFSTFMLETGNLLQVRAEFRAFLNVAASFLLGYAAFRLGAVLGRAW